MPYSRRNTSFYRRGRRYSRRGRALRTTNVLTRTSARSQARQIFALNKKVNRLNYLARPEVKIYDNGVDPYVFDTANEGSLNPQVSSLSFVPFEPTLPTIGYANLYKIRSFNLNINVTYGDNYLQNPGKNASRIFGLRFILVQLLMPSEQIPSITDILKFDKARPDINGVVPLRDGVTATVRVISDWRYTLSDQRPVITRRLFFKRMNDIVFNTADLPAVVHPSGGVCLYVIPFGYHLIEGFEQQVHLSMEYKYAYTHD